MRWVGIAEAAEGAAELELDARGVPRTPLLLVDLSAPADAVTIRRAAELVRTSARVVVGLCPEVLPARVKELSQACTVTLTHEEQGPFTVRVPDLDDAAALLMKTTSATPRAAAVLGPLLRLTSGLPVRDGLVAESLAYSMLLAGPEFAGWRAGRPVRNPPVPSGDPVLVRRDDDVLTLSLARPARHNAFSREVRDALVEALGLAVHDPSLQVVLEGAGPSFCSGGDLDEFGSTTDVSVAHHVRMARSAALLLHALRERTTVRVHGACIGAGVELPAFSNHVVATRNARFRLPELTMGLVPGAGGTVSVTARIGRWRTAWMVLTANDVDAPTALRWGLVDEVV